MKVAIRRLAVRLLAQAVAIAVASAPVSASAQQSGKQGLPIVRDAEIEGLVSDYVRPLLKAAGLSRSGIEVVLVNQPSFNAFVTGRRIFINTGTIVTAETPGEVIGVLAHEIGHLAGGHELQLREQLEHAQTIAIVAGLLGLGAMAAGAASGQGEVAKLGTGVFAGGSNAAMRSIFAYQRSEETTADRSALTYLLRTKQSPAGLLHSLERLSRANMLSGVQTSAYVTSHPLPRDRLANLETAAHESPYFDKPTDPALQLRHDLARAKIAAYTGGAVAVRRAFRADPRGLAARYGDAIATHLNGSPAEALRKIEALVKEEPRNPWFQEIRGEILMQAGKSSAAAAAYSEAFKLDPSHSGLLEAEIGQAIVTGGDASKMKDAIAYIRRGLRSDPDNSTAYRFLAMAYGKTGAIGDAELATAEGYWHAGAFQTAKVFAARAQQKLKTGTPPWVRAQDIIQAKNRAKN